MNAPSASRSFSSHPLFLLAVSFACGIVVARFVNVHLWAAVPAGLCFFALAAFALVKRREGAASCLLLFAFLSAGAVFAALEKISHSANRIERLYSEGTLASGEPVELTGVMERAPESAPDGFYLTLRVEELRFKEREREATGVVWLFAPVRDAATRAEYDELELRYGARIRVMVALRRAESFRNPGVASFTEYLERRGYDASATVKSPLLVERLDDERVFLPLMWLYEWRSRMLSAIDRSFERETAGVLKASLLGNRYHLSRGAAERFREGGTFHILVISGLHISFIGALVFLVMRRLTKRRAWQFAASVLFLWAYTVAVGAESSVVRAALMFTVVALGPVLHRRATALNALGAAALCLLVWRSSDLFDPSFQLTFLSVLGIVAAGWPLVQSLKAVGEWRPTRETPSPPVCPSFWRRLGEILYWREREWKLEMEHAVYSYRLWKHPLAAKLEQWRVQSLLRHAFNALAVSTSVQLLLLPLLVVYFHRVSVASLILNIGVGALMVILSLVALAALALAELSTTLAAPLVWLAEHVNWLMIHSVDPFTSARVASIRLPQYSGWAAGIYFLYYVPLVILTRSLSGWNPLGKIFAYEKDEPRTVRFATVGASVSLVALIVVIVLHPWSAGVMDRRLRVDFLDVGQGDAALVTMPDGTTLLVDGGGRVDYKRSANQSSDVDDEPFERDARSVGEMVVSEYLWWRGLDRVDYILATHADTDHIDGLNDVVQNFSVRAAFVGRTPARDAEYARFARTAAGVGVPLYAIGRGDLLQFGAVSAEVLWPERTSNVEAPSGNDDSVVLRLRLGERVFLLTGDAERNAERALVRAEGDGLRSDVLKVAHHGSKTSSIESFVRATTPAYAVISVGLDSIFGHPHREVVERWRASGAQILTTGRSGTITVTTDGHDLQVETFVKE